MQKNKLSNILEVLRKASRKNKWVATYNKTLDYFSWTKYPLSRSSRLIKISHDVLLHVNGKSVVEGFDLQYLTGNFIEHHNSYKELPDLFTKEIGGGVFTIPSNKKKKFDDTVQGFVDKVSLDVYKDTISNQSSKDIESLISTALASKA